MNQQEGHPIHQYRMCPGQMRNADNVAYVMSANSWLRASRLDRASAAKVMQPFK